MWAYVRDNLWAGIKTSPFAVPRVWWILPVYGAIALAIGLGSGLLRFEPMRSSIAWVLPFTMVISPSLIEESLFRGLLIPRDIGEKGFKPAAIRIGLSTTAFVAWHPIVALTFRPAVAPVFLDPVFLVIVTLLGLACGISYVISKSLWAPILIHWSTVVPWVLFLGGLNIMLEI